jgi:glycine oxidase
VSGEASRADVVVVGAGAIGLSIALRLSQHGVTVTVLDQGEPGREASWAAAGILSAQGEAQAPGPLLDLLLEGERRFPDFVAEMEGLTGESCGYQACGALHLAGDAQEATALEAQRAWQLQRGLSVEAWDAAALQEAEPSLAPSFIAANRFPSSARVQPRRVCAALVLALRARGVRLQRGKVEAIEREGDRLVGLRVDGQRWPASRVVLAAGAWSSLIAGTGLAPDAIVPVRGQLVRFDASLPVVRHVVFAEGGYLVPIGKQALIVGSTMERVGFDRGLTREAQETITARARRICPALAVLEPSEAWSGFRPATRDELPALGPTPIEGLHLAVGHYRNGILLAPITAALVTAASLQDSGRMASASASLASIPARVAAARLYA